MMLKHNLKTKLKKLSIMAWGTRTDNEDVSFKEQILAKVRNALIEKPEAMFMDVDQRSETWVPISEDDGTAITFAQNFKDLGGIFIYLESKNEFAECLRQLAPENGWEPVWCTSPAMQALLKRYGIDYTEASEREPKQKLVSLTDCECLVAQTGSVLLSDDLSGSRLSYALPDVLLVFATTDQIVGGVKEAFRYVRNHHGNKMPSQLTFVTGPSRTTDIEQTLVIGANGIRQVAVFLVDAE
jgi:L-lactate dehydrogenase complex protein LldG